MRLKSKQRRYRRRKINPLSDRQRHINRLYAKIKTKWWAVEGQGWCPVMLQIFGQAERVQDVHHMRGTLGTLKIDTRFWLAVSRAGHCWIESNRELARQHGWLAARGDWCKSPFDTGTILLQKVLE
jgi:hypothetical protein